MGLNITRTALVIHPDHGTIRIIPKGGRNVIIDAPEAFRIVETKERARRKRRKNRKNRQAPEIPKP